MPTVRRQRRFLTEKEKGRRRLSAGRMAVPVSAAALVLLLLTALTVLTALTAGRRGRTDGTPRVHTARPGEKYIVAVDSGHGGADTGAVGLVKETDVTQRTAAALLALLEEDPAYTPVQVHTDAQEMTPAQRTEAAAEAEAQLFLSVHANKDTHPESHGFECFAVPPGHDRHEESLRFAALLAEEMAAAGARLRGECGVRYAYYTGHGKLLREASDLTVYTWPTFGVLQTAPCPAVLAEQCFISNAEDVDEWGDAEGCDTVAECYYRAICAYFGTTPLVSDHS